MARVKVSIGDLKCVRQADSIATDDVYWMANLRCAAAVDQTHTNMARLPMDESYRTSQPELLSIGSGQTSRFKNALIYDEEVRPGWYVFGTVHFLERDTPLSNFVAKMTSLLGIIFGGLVMAGVIGFAIGYWMGGLATAGGTAILAVALVGVVGFFVGALIELTRPVEGDVHLGGMPIKVGPIGAPPPNSDKDTLQLTLAASGKLEVVDAHGAELAIYPSSHMHHAVALGHRYETTLQLEISGGHR